jgi:hypothetical protein
MVKPIVFGTLLLIGVADSSFAQECLHGRNETAGNRERREQAIRVAHAINAAQAASIAVNPRATYKRLSELKLPEIPENFQVTLHVNGRQTYAFSLKDFADPCYFAVFSDQDRFVYATHPEPGAPVIVPAQPR